MLLAVVPPTLRAPPVPPPPAAALPPAAWLPPPSLPPPPAAAHPPAAWHPPSELPPEEEPAQEENEVTEVEHDKEDRDTPVVYRIRARLVPQCRVVLYYSTAGSRGTVGNTGYIVASVIVVNQLCR